MAHQKVLTAIDIGTDKCVTLIATISRQTGQMQVVGVSAVPAKGVKRSQIIDLEQVLSCLSESVDGAERMAGVEIKSATVGVSGAHILSQNSKGVVAVAAPSQEITPEDVNRVIEAARAISLPSDRELIHIIPKSFKVDSQEGIKDPVGMTGVRLETEAHIITGMTTALKNIEKCILELGINIDAFVFSGLASAQVTLTDTEKELGVMAVDLGAGTTSICAYVDGALEYSGSIPVGARHITQDIALGCRVSMDAAEKIKLHLGSELTSTIAPKEGETKIEFNRRKKELDTIRLSDLGVGSDEVLSKRHITEGIMLPRLKEVCTLIGEQLEKRGLIELVPAGLVISGGGAKTCGLIEVAKKTLQLPARVAIPQELPGLTSDICDPLYATSLGLLDFAQKGQSSSQKGEFSLPGFSPQIIFKTVGRLFHAIKSLAPKS